MLPAAPYVHACPFAYPISRACVKPLLGAEKKEQILQRWRAAPVLQEDSTVQRGEGGWSLLLESMH